MQHLARARYPNVWMNNPLEPMLAKFKNNNFD